MDSCFFIIILIYSICWVISVYNKIFFKVGRDLNVKFGFKIFLWVGFGSRILFVVE